MKTNIDGTSGKPHILAGLAMVLVLAGCEQASQSLPFAVDSEETATRTVSSAGAVITSASGLALHIPAGALSQATEISVTPAAPPAVVSSSGSPISRGFRIDPTDLTLDRPALVEVRFDRQIESDNAWLASLVVVSQDGIEEVGNTRLDLRARLAETEIQRLGTVTMVIPEPDAVFIAPGGEAQQSLGPANSDLLPTGTDSVVAGCGARGNRCAGLSVSASHGVLARVARLAAVFPALSGSLVIDGQKATGELVLQSSVRLLLRSGASAENFGFHGLLRPTAGTVVTEDASAITLTNMLVRVSAGPGDLGSSVESTSDVVIQKVGNGGTVSLSRSFELIDEDGSRETASLAIRFPLQLHQ